MADSESPYWFITNCNPATGWVDSLDSATLNLASGQYQDVQVTFSVRQDAVPGETDYWSVVASAAVPGCSSARASAAVGGWLKITVT